MATGSNFRFGFFKQAIVQTKPLKADNPLKKRRKGQT